MGRRRRLAQTLTARLRAAQEADDPAGLLDEETYRLTRELSNLAFDDWRWRLPGRRLKRPVAGMFRVCAWIHWYRYMLDEDTDREELLLSMLLFSMSAPWDEEDLPALLVPIFVPGYAGDLPHDFDDIDNWNGLGEALFEIAAEDDFAREWAFMFTDLAIDGHDILADPPADVLIGTGLLAQTALEHEFSQRLLDDVVALARRALDITVPGDPQHIRSLGLYGFAVAAMAEHGDRSQVEAAIARIREALPGNEDDEFVVYAAGALLTLAAIRTRDMADYDFFYEIRPFMRRALAGRDHDTPGRRELLIGMALTAAGQHINRNDATGLRESTEELAGLLATMTPGEPFYAMVSFMRVATAWLSRMLSGPSYLEDEELQTLRRLVADEGADLDFLSDYAVMLGAMLTQHADVVPDAIEEAIAVLSGLLARYPKDSRAHRELDAELALKQWAAAGEAVRLDQLDGFIARVWASAADSDPASNTLATVLSDLAPMLADRFRLTGDEADYRTARDTYREITAIRVASLLNRMLASWNGGHFAAAHHRWADAAELFGAGIGMMPELAWRGLARADQEKQVLLWSGAVNEGAAAAILAGDPRRAVEMLEHGRTIFIGTALDNDSDVARLGREHPGQAHELTELQAQIAGLEPIEIYQAGTRPGRTPLSTSDRERRQRLGVRWEQAVARIRALPGFADFLRPPRFGALVPRAGQTVVIVNVADLGSHALIVTAERLEVVPLPELEPAECRQNTLDFLEALRHRPHTAGTAEQRVAAATFTRITDWLWRAVAEPVLSAMGIDGGPRDPAGLPHVHWCPTYMLTFLPLHAAQRHPPSEGDSAMDRVISSYVPNLRILRRFGDGAVQPPGTPLVIAQPETPGLPKLPGAVKEAGFLCDRFPDALVLAGAEATRARVLAELPRRRWVHFACHGAQDVDNPSRARLFLHDHAQRPLLAADVATLRLGGAELAYLSACQTAQGGVGIPDEHVHVGAALLVAGFRHVVATLWPISDRLAIAVTRDFYEHAAELGPARALHRALLALRLRTGEGNPAQWCSYVHFGP